MSRINEARMNLGLGENFSLIELREAYRKKALKYHPDKCGDEKRKECEDRFKSLQEDHRYLMDILLNHKFTVREIEENGTGDKEHLKDHMKRFYDGWWGVSL